MSAKNPGFILDPKNLKEKHFELVGREAIDFAFLLKENIPIPSSFVIATTAFDDFLMHTNLVGPIATSLKKVRPFIRKTAVEASAEIKNLIMAAQISDNLTRELEDAYKKLSKHNENPIVIMMQSHIIDERFTPPPSAPLQEIILQGIDDLIYQIKSAWAELFSVDAIEFRANGYYHGEITVALIVQKLIRAEVSGIANSATHVSKNEIEIQAIYGIEHEKTVEFADEYIIDAKSLKVTHVHAVQQDFMYIHELNQRDKNKYLKIELSSSWKKNQKLDSDVLRYLAKITKKIKDIFRQDVSLKWGIESGEIFILSLDPLVLPVEDIVNIQKNEQLETLRKSENKKKVSKEKDPDIDELAKEVIEIVENQMEENIPGIPGIQEEGVKESDIALPKLTKDKEPEDEKIKYLDEFRFNSSLYLDISRMNSKHLSALPYFSGSFFDGTEMILNNNVLPEEHLEDKSTLIHLFDKYSLDISTAARCAIHKPMMYQLSSISEFELQLLGVSESKYKYTLDERFIDFPESLSLEVMAIRKSITHHNNKNIQICLPSLRNLSNLEDIKKVLETNGLKKTAAFRLYAEVGIPSFIFELDRMQKNELDGIVVNYSRLLKALVFRNEIRDTDHVIGIKALQLLKAIAQEKNLEFAIRLNIYTDEVINAIAELHPNTLIFTSIPSEATLKVIGKHK